jgi:uncharacterized protein (DUF1501 family)
MAMTRRQLIAAAGGAAAAHALLPAVARVGEAFGAAPVHPDTYQRNRLVVIHLLGGNDGLSTLVPVGGHNAAIYRKVRPSLAYKPSQTLPLDHARDRGHHIGLNSVLPTAHRLYRQNRMAVVQGVDYPEHSFSHFTSSDVWHSGEPGSAPHSGWLGRHLDRTGVHEGELRALGLGNEMPLMLLGDKRNGGTIRSIESTHFGDGSALLADARHEALALFDHHSRKEPLRAWAGHGARQAVDLVDALSRVTPPPATNSNLADQMLNARALLGADLGVECVFIQAPGHDTHTDQRSAWEVRMRDLDSALEAFFFGTYQGKSLHIGPMSGYLASRTMVMVISEFGRRIGENGTGAGAGTDHGAATPVLLFGPPEGGAVPGLHGDTPDLGTTKLPADNVRMTTDMRRVYQAVLTHWLHDPDPLYRRLGALPGLFAS